MVCTERTQARFELIPNVGVLGSLARQHTWDTHACLGLVYTVHCAWLESGEWGSGAVALQINNMQLL